MDYGKVKKKQKDINGYDTSIMVPLLPNKNDLVWPAATPGFKRTRVTFSDLLEKYSIDASNKPAADPQEPKPSSNYSSLKMK